jgi:hypothetical protein
MNPELLTIEKVAEKNAETINRILAEQKQIRINHLVDCLSQLVSHVDENGELNIKKDCSVYNALKVIIRNNK